MDFLSVNITGKIVTQCYGGAACMFSHYTPTGLEDEGWPQRSVPLWLWQEVQKVLHSGTSQTLLSHLNSPIPGRWYGSFSLPCGKSCRQEHVEGIDQSRKGQVQEGYSSIGRNVHLPRTTVEVDFFSFSFFLRL